MIEKVKEKTKEKNKNAWKYWNSKRELTFKPTTVKSLSLFVVPKLYIKYRKIKDGLYLKSIIHLKILFT